MTATNRAKGLAFEYWIKDILGKFVNIEKSREGERYDLRFKYKDTFYLLECKCFSLVTKEGGLGQIAFKRKQLSALLNRRGTVNGEKKEVLYIGGALLNTYEVYATVIPVQKVYDYGKQYNGKSYVHYAMSKVLREQSLRNWMSKTFKVNENELQFPEFRRYVLFPKATDRP